MPQLMLLLLLLLLEDSLTLTHVSGRVETPQESRIGRRVFVDQSHR